MTKIVRAVALAGLVASGWSMAALEPSRQDAVVRFAENLMVPMRDGVRLATDIYRPAVGGVPVADKLPLLLHRTGYDKTGAALVRQARAFAAHGYVVAVQDDRGTYGSEGVQYKYVGWGKDGYDTIEWLARLPYTNGVVGMWGTSYAAHTQASAAILRPPHLKTIVLNMGGLYNGWHHKIRNHGAFELAQQVGWAFTQLAEQVNDRTAHDLMAREKAADWVGALRARPGLTPLAVAPNFESYIFDMLTHGDYDDYWKQGDLNWSEHYAETADIPMLHVSGWYDAYTAGAINNFVGLSRAKTSPVRLLVGPWLHGRNTQSNAGDVEFGSDAAIRDFSEAFHVRWFDHFLKGTENGVAAEPRVTLFVMGGGDGHKDQNGRLTHGGAWTTADAWPLPGTTFVDLYFHADGTLSRQTPDAAGSGTTYSYDPRSPVPTVGGSFSSQPGLVAAGAFDQREGSFEGDPGKGFFGSRPPYLPLRARDDVAVFQTAPLAEDVAVVGPIVVKLFASSSAIDTDFTAKLIDVYPPSPDYPAGFDMNLTDGIIRARYRNSPARAELMKPGEVYEFTIEPFPTANVFRMGHRIRVDISSSNFPRFDVNPNTGEPLGLNRRAVVAENTVWHDRDHPSHVVLPLRNQPWR
jgi:putative CocE/NonD family hydrolase